MKIRLTAFDKLYGDVMDVPEETGNKFDLVLIQPIAVATEKTPERPNFTTKCTFEWIGKDLSTGARIYNLTDISKI
jgi:hypothetical protein